MKTYNRQHGICFDIFTSTCDCKGKGWILTNQDVWVQCHFHGTVVPHPEDEQVTNEEILKARINSHRIHYRLLREDTSNLLKNADLGGINFHQACLTYWERTPANSFEWTDAAACVFRTVEDNLKCGLGPLDGI